MVYIQRHLAMVMTVHGIGLRPSGQPSCHAWTFTLHSAAYNRRWI